MDEDPAEVVRVLFDAVVEDLDLLLVEKTQYVLLELTTPLTRNNLNEPNSLVDRLVNDLSKGAVDIVPAVVDLVQIEFQLHNVCLPARTVGRADDGRSVRGNTDSIA